MDRSDPIMLILGHIKIKVLMMANKHLFNDDYRPQNNSVTDGKGQVDEHT